MKSLSSKLAAVLLAAVSLPAAAEVVDAFDRGWYQQNLVTLAVNHQPGNLNYYLGIGGATFNTPQGPVVQSISSRSFFGFDLSAYAGQTFTSATLHLYNPKVGDPMHNPGGTGTASENGFFQFNNDPANTRQCFRAPAPASLVPCEGYELFDIVSDINALLAGTGGLTAYNDMANGTLYGSFIVTAADNGNFVDVTLNAAGLAAINAAAGNQFFVGARQFTADNGLGSQGSFGFTDNDLADTQLILTVASSNVPEPGSLALAGLALAAIGAARRKARKQGA